MLHRAVGEYDRAIAVCGQAHELFVATGDRLMLAYSAQAIAKTLVRLGRHDEAASLLGPCLDTCAEAGDRFGGALVTRTIGELQLARGDIDDAVRSLDEVVRRWDELDLPLWRARTQRDLAAALRACGDGKAATLMGAAALRVFRRYGSREAGETALSVPSRTFRG
ncbi:tetratricopeptide repeat protein [Lentzea pudingi]|uniref:tetratricopeptide repeat protein n=1 Tax=Lentzea pudingi TaxID=1789439 RepID=UPI00166CF4DD|nr:tetratricopeptide repeat protein [Lentzea pudingi]